MDFGTDPEFRSQCPRWRHRAGPSSNLGPFMYTGQNCYFLLLHWKIISSKTLRPFMGVFIVVNVWSGKAWIVNVPLYKMTIFRGLMPAQNCLHDVMIKVRFYACSMATWSHYSKFAVPYLLIYVCNIILDIFVCSCEVCWASFPVPSINYVRS